MGNGSRPNLLIMFQGNSDIKKIGQCLKEETPGVKESISGKRQECLGKTKKALFRYNEK